MITHGKVLFYNEQNGTGISITKDNQKIKFSIEEWNNYDAMPCLGLEISFIIENDLATKINVIEINKTEKELSTPQTNLDIQSNERNESSKKQTHHKYKNAELTSAEKELNMLLNSSSDNLESLNKRISLSMDITDTMHDYFSHLKKQLTKREGYKKVNGRLDYTLARRFLWTTFNNLVDIDNKIVTLRIKSISDDLKFFSNIKDNFDKKIKYPLVAFQDIFLSSQSEYTIVKQVTADTIDRLSLLRNKEETMNAEKKKKQNDILKCKNKKDLAVLTKELKVLNGTYADIVHMMALLQEIHEKNTKRLSEFENTYKENFYKTFQEEAKKHKKSILQILNAQAYLLDFLLWKEAKSSPATLRYFKSLSVDIELNTKTYLKYYLSTLDEDKAGKDSQDLFALYDHLVEVQKDYILVLTASSQEAMNYTNTIRSSDKSLEVKSFISELESLKWAMTNTIKLIVIEDTLISTSAKKYLDYYHNHIFSKPKIILIGDDAEIKSNYYTISKTLPNYVQPKILAETLTSLINS